MNPKGLLIAVGLLAVLGGATWWSNKKQASASKSTDTTTKVLSIPADQVQEVRVKNPAQTLDLRRDNGKWQMTQPEALPADQDTVGSLVGTFSALNADTVVEAKAADLAPYGLTSPKLDVQIVKKDGKTDNLLIGDETPTGSGSYAKLANDARVFTIGSFVKTSIDKTPNDLRDKRLLTFDSDKLTRVDLQAKNENVEFGKNNQNEWQILKPRPLRADGSQVDTLVNSLKDVRMDLSDDAKKASAAFSSGARVATATVADAGGNQTIEVRKDKDNYYAKSTAVAGIYKVSADFGKNLDKKLDDFRNKKLFEFGFSDPSKIELKAATYTKNGDKWMSGSKTMDNGSVQNLIDKLRDLTATTFADKAAADPIFEATVTSNMGKRVEKVTISKQGDKYFAKRGDEPSIYGLDGKAVDDLQKAASDVKEAAPPAPAKKK
jgi:ribosomal protein L12E/L44/L45/RPP1/RPP2